MPFVAGNLSVRGLGHLRANTLCQDSSGVVEVGNGVVVGAVADGGGSAKLSHIGSNLAAQTALSALALVGRTIDLATLQEPQWRQICTDVLEDVRRIILEEARIMQLGDAGVPHFGTTLLAFIASRSRLAALQVGDGFIVATRSGTTEEGAPRFDIAFKPERGEYTGETVRVTSSGWEKDMKAQVFDGPFDFVCVASDGLEKVAIRQTDNEPFQPYFTALRNGAHVAADPAALVAFISAVLRDKRLDQKTDDDKSMVLVVWADQSPTSQADAVVRA